MTWAAPDLRGRVAVVTGASRGVGRGIALALGDCGATVYVTGRSTRAPGGTATAAPAGPGTVEDAAEAVTARGGHGIAAPTDHTDDGRVAALFARVAEEQDGRPTSSSQTPGVATRATSGRSSRNRSGRARPLGGTRCSRAACAPSSRRPAPRPPR